MNTSILITGESGTGKSTSITNLDPKETFIISVIGKPLPIRNFKDKYKPIVNWEDKKNNLYVSDDYRSILQCIKIVNLRPDIKTIIVDDWQYLLANEFMIRCSEKGYGKFSEIANHGWLVLNALNKLRDDLTAVVFSHNQADDQGILRCKTIGKMLDDKICIEGMFSIVLSSMITEHGYKFMTQGTQSIIAKSPMGMFEKTLINNDLKIVLSGVKNYYGVEEVEEVVEIVNPELTSGAGEIIELAYKCEITERVLLEKMQSREPEIKFIAHASAELKEAVIKWLKETLQQKEQIND
jgi:hypothetical protein